MKKAIITFAISALVAGAMITACDSSAKKVADAEDKVEETKSDAASARIDLNQAKEDSIYEYQKFRDESKAKIQARNKSMREFKERIAYSGVRCLDYNRKWQFCQPRHVGRQQYK